MTTATPIEVRKIAYRQSAKDGLVITFSVHPSDMPASLAAAPIGARFMAALVEIGDDEKPVKSNTHKALEASVEKERRPWGELTPTTQACIRCQEPRFQQWVIEGGFKEVPDDKEKNAACYVRKVCKVNTRGMLSTDPAARAAWRSLDKEFQETMQAERAFG